MEALYDRIGGAEAISTAVDVFYEKILSDERINFFFENIDMTLQKHQQSMFLSMLGGEVGGYDGRDMSQAHARLIPMGLNDTHVDIVLEHFHTTLVDLGLHEDVIAEMVALLETARDDVLNR